MNFNKALIFGSIVGVASATVWAAIAYFADLEIGWLAWGIGFVVGYACLLGAGQGSRLIGTTATVITLLAILLGKYATVELVVRKEFGDPEAMAQESIAALSDEMLTSYVADAIVGQYQQNGEKVDWPPGVDPESASTKAEYPAEIWRLAEEHWNTLSLEDKQAFREEVEANIREGFNVNFDELQDNIRNQGFLQSFGLIDLVFFGLALSTAYTVGKSNESMENTETKGPHSDDSIPALQ